MNNSLQFFDELLLLLDSLAPKMNFLFEYFDQQAVVIVLMVMMMVVIMVKMVMVMIMVMMMVVMLVVRLSFF